MFSHLPAPLLSVVHTGRGDKGQPDDGNGVGDIGRAQCLCWHGYKLCPAACPHHAGVSLRRLCALVECLDIITDTDVL